MHVMVVPADRGGCGYYRLIWPAQAVSGVRPDWAISIVPPEKVQAGFVGGKFTGVRGFPDPLPDVLVMQRVGTPAQYSILKWAHEQGIATVVDFDDAMWAIDRDNYAWPMWNLPNPSRQHWKWCDDSVHWADLVTVTTEGLARRYGRHHGRIEILPNSVPFTATQLPVHERDGIFTAGWAGFTSTHPGDCRVTTPAAKTVLLSDGRLRVVADAVGAAREWGIEPELVDSIPPRRLGVDYFTALSTLDLMLVGLQDTLFNRSKSTLKVIEAASVGVPSIAPDNPPHRALAKSGFPILLAATPADWEIHTKEVMSLSDEQYAHLSGTVRQAVVDGWTIEGNAEHWAQAWERARDRRS